MPEEIEYIIHIAGLILKYHRGELTGEESLELKVWCAQSQKNQVLFDRMSEPGFIKNGIKELPDIQLLKKLGWDRVVSGIEAYEPGVMTSPIKRISWKRYVVAACLLGLAALGAWIYLSRRPSAGMKDPAQLASRFRNDVAPGRERAVLTLSDGSRVDLDSAARGLVAQQAGSLIKKETGILNYTPTANKVSASEVVYNTLTTPAASQYQIALPDGSRVWLNNASSLRYPVAFTGKDRTVELRGEAYFEITKNASQPFTVKVGSMSIDVLGTSFNVSAYSSEDGVKTTLLSGGVRVVRAANEVVLKPGEQVAAGDAGSWKLLQDVDTEGVIAWKNGLFHFERSDLQSVMRLLSRWYDVEVVYEGAVPNRTFGGEIQRNLSLTQVLEILQKNQVHFDLEGRTITVRP